MSCCDWYVMEPGEKGPTLPGAKPYFTRIDAAHTHTHTPSRFAGDAFDYLDAPPERITGVDIPLPYAANLEQLSLPQVDNIVNAIKRTTERKL